MTPTESTDTPALSDLHDRELEHHLATLGLRTVEDYVDWCARNGFSQRIDKHWHLRCKERYFSLRQDLQSRSTRKKRESRHPREVIHQIAEGKLDPADLTQPQFASISAAFASLEGDARDAFLRLLLHVQEHADLFCTGPVIRQLGTQPGNTFIDGLSVLAKHHQSWLHPVKQWKVQTHNSRRQFSSLARHLLAKYPMPAFLDSVWFRGETPEAERQQQWFIQIGDGESPRHLDFPVRLTHRMAHHFLRTPTDCTVEVACRRAQVLGLGGTVPLAEAVPGTHLATDFSQEEFWTAVIRWLIANPLADMDQVAPVVDYICHQKWVACPEFSIQGRTPDTILRQLRQWHEGSAEGTPANPSNVVQMWNQRV